MFLLSIFVIIYILKQQKFLRIRFSIFFINYLFLKYFLYILFIIYYLSVDNHK